MNMDIFCDICLFKAYKVSLHRFPGTTGHPKCCALHQILPTFKTQAMIFRGAEKLKQLDISAVAI